MVKTKTTIELDRDLWNEIKSRAYREGTTVSDVLEKLLRQVLGEKK